MTARQKRLHKKDTASAEDLGLRRPAGGVLGRLTGEEGAGVLHVLLEKHPNLRSEAEQIAAGLVSSTPAEDTATDVLTRVTAIGLDELNTRAGSHSWGYVEPSEAAVELLGEALEDVIEDMKRKAELGFADAAEACCAGIVEGLYRARHVQSDGALGWAPDFLIEEAAFALEELARAFPAAHRRAMLQHLPETLVSRAPEWEDMFRRVAKQCPDKG